MISIKRYLTKPNPGAADVFRRVISILLQAVELHAVEGDEADYTQFRFAIRQIADQFSDDTPAEQSLVIAGSVAATLRDYNERTSRYIRAQSSEYHRMVSMLTETVLDVTHGSERSVQRLREIEQQLERASVIEDVRILRLKLDQCLQSIQEEIQQQASEAAATVGRLSETIKESQGKLETAGAGADSDPVTALPSVPAAERALMNTAQGGRNAYAVAVVPNTLQAINARYGHEAGDRVLRKACEHLRSSLPTEAALFRWRGPCFVALLERGSKVEEVRSEMAAIASAKIEDVTEIAGRTVLLLVTLSWTVFAVKGSPRELALRIDQFVAAQGGAGRPLDRRRGRVAQIHEPDQA
jgi:diguanylate cyclase (GGDEF)-like protein